MSGRGPKGRSSRRAGGRGAARRDPRSPGEARWFAELVPGLEEFGLAELKRLGATGLRRVADGARFESRSPERMAGARTVAAVYLSLSFAVPRPKALLGDEAFRRLASGAARVAGERGEGSRLSGASFHGLRVAAAGADSPVMLRLAAELARALELPHDPEEGDLLVRLRPDPAGRGWEALVRLTPRPNTARAWRSCNRPGGLNAAVAAAMNELTGMKPGDRYLNLMCGSGTLLVERALQAPAQRLVGVDVDPEAVACARLNAEAAGVAERCELRVSDVADLGPGAAPFGEPFDVLSADAPWGDAVGVHRENRRLYELLLVKAAGLATHGARFALLTHEIRLTRALLAEQADWTVARELQVAHGGHNPLLLLLTRA